MQVGIDVLELSRFEDIAKSKAKLSKMFTNNELEYFNKFQNPLSHVVGCFCCKEAFVKALKIGFGNEMGLKDVEVLHEENGSPYININLKKVKNILKGRKVDVNISHCDTIATAICVIN